MILVTTIVDLWVESHNWQFLSGDHKLLSSASIAALDLTHLLQRVSKKCADRFLKLSVYLSHTKIKQEEVVVDTNIREKNTLPTTNLGQKGYRHLQEDRQQGRNSPKAKLLSYCSTPASSCI